MKSIKLLLRNRHKLHKYSKWSFLEKRLTYLRQEKCNLRDLLTIPGLAFHWIFSTTIKNREIIWLSEIADKLNTQDIVHAINRSILHSTLEKKHWNVHITGQQPLRLNRQYFSFNFKQENYFLKLQAMTMTILTHCRMGLKYS